MRVGLPVMKLIGKERDGAKVRKKYDTPETPFQRAVDLKVVGEEARAEFETAMAERGPLALKRRMDAEIEGLWRLRAESTRHSATAS